MQSTEVLSTYPGNPARMFVRCIHGRGGWTRSFVEAPPITRAQRGSKAHGCSHSGDTTDGLQESFASRGLCEPVHGIHVQVCSVLPMQVRAHHRDRIEVLPSCRSHGGLDFLGRWGPGSRGRPRGLSGEPLPPCRDSVAMCLGCAVDHLPPRAAPPFPAPT